MPRRNNIIRRRRVRRNNNNNNKIMPMLRSVLGQTVRKLIQTVQVVSATAASSLLTFSPLGFTYYNLNDLANAVDFQNMATAYQVCKFVKIKLIFNRVISETQLTTVFPGGIETLYVGYFPTVSSTTISAAGITSLENAMIVSPFNNRSTSRVFVLPNIIAPSTPAISLTQFFSVNNISNIKGEFCIGSYGTGAAAVSSNIYSLTVQAEIIFAVPF